MQAVVDVIAAFVLALAAAAFSHFGVSFERTEARPPSEAPREVERTPSREDEARREAFLAVRARGTDCPEQVRHA